MFWYSHLFQNFPQFIVIHAVKAFGIVNKAEISVFLELAGFFYDPIDVGNLISHSSAFSKFILHIWKFSPGSGCWGRVHRELSRGREHPGACQGRGTLGWHIGGGGSQFCSRGLPLWLVSPILWAPGSPSMGIQ